MATCVTRNGNHLGSTNHRYSAHSLSERTINTAFSTVTTLSQPIKTTPLLDPTQPPNVFQLFSSRTRSFVKNSNTTTPRPLGFQRSERNIYTHPHHFSYKRKRQ